MFKNQIALFRKQNLLPVNFCICKLSYGNAKATFLNQGWLLASFLVSISSVITNCVYADNCMVVFHFSHLLYYSDVHQHGASERAQRESSGVRTTLRKLFGRVRKFK